MATPLGARVMIDRTDTSSGRAFVYGALAFSGGLAVLMGTYLSMF